MKKTFIFILVNFLIFLFIVSCERIPPAEGDLSSNTVALEGVPSSYGKLVGITTITAYPNWVQMWFVDDSGTIRMVRVNFIANRIHKDIKVISRY